MHALPAAQPTPAAVLRLTALASLDGDARAALDLAIRRPRTFRARRDMLAEGQEITETLLILSGWAARVRLLPDGRRQILNFLLPGNLIGLCDHARPVASSTILAITDVDTCIAPAASVSPSLGRAYAMSRALEEAHLLAQITRLGRLNAQQKVGDLLLELLDRLELAGLAANGRYLMPLTQETLADALGLTSVHVNRTLQALRREGFVDWKGREVVIPDPAALGRSIGCPPIRVTTR